MPATWHQCLCFSRQCRRCCFLALEVAPFSATCFAELIIRSGRNETYPNLWFALPLPVNGNHRYAEVFEAQGEKQKAAQYYRKAADFAGHAEGFDQESVDYFGKKAEELVTSDKQ